MLRSAGMAKDKDDIPTLTLEVLKDIRGDMREMKGDIHEMKADMRQMNHRMENVEGELKTLTKEVKTLNGRFDHFLEFGGEAHRELDRRVAKLESHVFGTGEHP